MTYQNILVIDNFDSFTFNLVDYFRQLQCRVSVHRNTLDPARIADIHPDLIVMSPGPSVPENAGNLLAIIDQYHKTYPLFGVCLGHQALITYFGGTLKFITPVHGKASRIHHDNTGIFQGLPQDFLAGRYHSLVADRVPDCFEISAYIQDIHKPIQNADTARISIRNAAHVKPRNGVYNEYMSTEASVQQSCSLKGEQYIVMAVRHKTLPIWGVQFHPESLLTMKQGAGFSLIRNLIS